MRYIIDVRRDLAASDWSPLEPTVPASRAAAVLFPAGGAGEHLAIGSDAGRLTRGDEGDPWSFRGPVPGR